ncbi:MAG: PIN domain-containing protein [Candidatus Woesearchaeota archaeon]
MQLVIDANVLFSLLIKKSKIENLFFNEELELFAPEFIFTEFEKYKEIILRKTQRSDMEFYRLFTILKRIIKTIPNEETSKFITDAEEICPDTKDVDYFALALKLKCPIWSNDKKIKKQDNIEIYDSTELLKIFSDE